jgi:oligosaccharide repeat unit polymerase
LLNLLLYIILFAEIVFFTYFDKKVFANYFSPVIILSYPILIVVTITFITGPWLEFNPISSELFLLMIVGIALFWAGSLFWSRIVPLKVTEKFVNKISRPFNFASASFQKTVLIIAWVVILFLSWSFISTYRKYNNTDAIGTEEFVHSFGGSSLAGHIMGLTIPLLIIFIGIVKKKDYLIIITILFLLAISVLYQVKTWLYVPIIGGLLLRFFNKTQIKIKIVNVIIFVIVVMILFGLTYMFAMQDRKDFSFFEKVGLLFNHFMGYLFAGILGFGEHMNQHMPVGETPRALFMPFINLYHFIAGNPPEGVVSSYHVFIDKNNLVDVNVKTFFGTILINGGYLIGCIYVVGLSIFLYFLWIVATIAKNFWFIVLYVFFASALVLGWFDFYYNQLPFLELPAYLIIIIFVSNIKHKKHSENSNPGQS